MRFLHAHATHPRPELALELVWAQLVSQGALQLEATLGWCYLTDELSDGAEVIMASLRQHLPHVAWVGGVGSGVLSNRVEYMDEPALAVMLCNMPARDFRIFHGRQPLASRQGQWHAHTAQVHADGHSPDLPELIMELAARTATGLVFGGVSVGQAQGRHLALDPHANTPEDVPSGVWQGGLSGVAFSERVRLVSRVTQGCEPLGPRREITGAYRNVIYELDGLPALTCLLRDLGVPANMSDADCLEEALPKVRTTLVGLTDATSDLLSHGQHFGADTRVRHLVGLDPSRSGVAISEVVEPGMQLAFGHRQVQAARQDLVRICAEIREEFDPTAQAANKAAGAIYISCTGRGGPHFGSPNAEMEIIARALGDDIPLVGMFAAGEIARHHIYGYTGVLTVFGS